MGHVPIPVGIYGCHGITLRVVVNTAATFEPESRLQTPCQTQQKDIGGKFSSEKENLPEEDPWCNWHKQEGILD